MQGYAQLPNAYLMRYEDLVLHPKETILALAERLTDEKVRDFEVNAEKETLRDAESAKAKVRDKEHLKAYKNSELSEICKLLNPELLKHFGYTDCDPFRP